MLFCCLTGYKSSEDGSLNLAEDFLSQNGKLTIERVYAPDTRITACTYINSAKNNTACSFYAWTYTDVEEINSIPYALKKNNSLLLSEADLKSKYPPYAEGFKLFKISDGVISRENCYSGEYDDVIPTHVYHSLTADGVLSDAYLLALDKGEYDPTDPAYLHNPISSLKAGEIPG